MQMCIRDRFYAAPNCYKATKVLDKIREKYDAALFIEQVEPVSYTHLAYREGPCSWGCSGSWLLWPGSIPADFHPCR